jgi:regulator of RNase E activity RraA
MVGEAFTLRYMPAREDLNPMTVFQNPDHPQRKAVELCPPGAVLVMDSRKDPRAASAGSILISRLMVRGAAGVVTDGGFRDSGRDRAAGDADLPQSPVRADQPDPAPGDRHQRADRCGDAPVFPGDVIVGDTDGVVVIPAHLAAEIAIEAVGMTAFEDFVTEEVLKGRSIIGLYPARTRPMPTSPPGARPMADERRPQLHRGRVGASGQLRRRRTSIASNTGDVLGRIP